MILPFTALFNDMPSKLLLGLTYGHRNAAPYHANEMIDFIEATH